MRVWPPPAPAETHDYERAMGTSTRTRKGRRIPYVDLAAQHAPLKAKLLEAIADVIDEGQFILGRQVADFEDEFAALCGVRHAVGRMMTLN